MDRTDSFVHRFFDECSWLVTVSRRIVYGPMALAQSEQYDNGVVHLVYTPA